MKTKTLPLILLLKRLGLLYGFQNVYVLHVAGGATRCPNDAVGAARLELSPVLGSFLPGVLLRRTTRRDGFLSLAASAGARRFVVLAPESELELAAGGRSTAALRSPSFSCWDRSSTAIAFWLKTPWIRSR